MICTYIMHYPTCHILEKEKRDGIGSVVKKHEKGGGQFRNCINPGMGRKGLGIHNGGKNKNK